MNQTTLTIALLELPRTLHIDATQEKNRSYFLKPRRFDLTLNTVARRPPRLGDCHFLQSGNQKTNSSRNLTLLGDALLAKFRRFLAGGPAAHQCAGDHAWSIYETWAFGLDLPGLKHKV